MKNFLLKLLTIIFALTLCLGIFTACGDTSETPNPPAHTHDYKTLKYNENSHWYECECKEKYNLAVHNLINNKCICGYEVEVHTHEYKTLKFNETSHWLECECKAKLNVEYHKGGIATETKKAKCIVCNQEYGALLEHTHDYKTLKYNENSHWYECECEEKSCIEIHKGGTPTETKKAVCSVCNQEYGSLLIPGHTHDYKTLKFDSTSHWQECSCGDKYNVENHNYSNGYVSNNNGTKTAICECGNIDVIVDENVLKVSGGRVDGLTDYGKTLKKIVIPNSVTSIGNYAFSDCDSLTSIVIPNSVTSIGDRAFYGCDLLEYYKKDGLKYLGNSENNYLYLAGVENQSITTATIDSSCKFIGDNAFYYCTSLESIEIPNSVTSIDDDAFKYCGSLIYNVKYGLNYLGNSENNYLYLAGVVNHSITMATIDSNCKFIGYYAFVGCTSLTSVVMPNSVTSIGDDAFYNCTSLESIVIPNSVTSIGYWAFAYCDSLTIYCKAESKPGGWSEDWNPSNCPVVWVYKGK